MDLNEHIIAAVDRYWADDVHILGAWSDGEASACVVYSRTIDPALILGQRFEFNAAAADGTVEGYARDIAINLAEPIGAAAKASRQDQYGILWVALRGSDPPPRLPADVADRVS
ncbi:hypothetical protein [Microbacterium rhizomatis]|uniref:Uncharacterized protein n=1 Tax=Microbacterium rhizomatis TaxID=1631477 RepID=A0A5J5IWK9_9MICO|nr:hypothetical protein [Microbacterium rhizomatis]KAA9104512.1 hypothetical protein F6B43_19275 [Microbacterium rhizomatis]